MDSITIRPSDITAWSLCPKRVELKDTQRAFPSYAMSRGSLVHARIEHELTGGRSFAWGDEYEQIVFNDTGQDLSDFKIPSAKLNQLVAQSELAFQAWQSQVQPRIEPYRVVVEYRLERELTDSVSIGGTPDAVIPDEQTILDWKTANAAWKTTKAAAELQPAAYTWLNGWTEGTFTFWVCDMSRYNWLPHTVHVTPQQVEAWVGLATQVAHSMNAGIYPATPKGQSWRGERGWHCSPKYCSAWNICDAKHLIADEMTTEVRDPRGEWT